MPRTKRQKLIRMIEKYIMIFIGAVLTAVGLELFLVPNQIIDGGIIGISILISHITDIPLAVLIVALNMPFLYLGYKQIGKTFAFSTIFAVMSLAGWVVYFRPIPELTNDLFLAAVFGGIVIGGGVGLIIRYGGSLDGTEIIAIILDKRTGFSVGEVVMVMNLFILASAGFVFSWDKAMYSLVAYFVAFKVIDITIEGLDETKGVIIVSDNPDEIAETLLARLGRGVTVLHGAGGFSGEPKKVLYSVITRLEIAKLKAIIYEKDENAFATVQDVHEVIGGRIKKKAIH